MAVSWGPNKKCVGINHARVVRSGAPGFGTIGLKEVGSQALGVLVGGLSRLCSGCLLESFVRCRQCVVFCVGTSCCLCLSNTLLG